MYDLLVSHMPREQSNPRAHTNHRLHIVRLGIFELDAKLLNTLQSSWLERSAWLSLKQMTDAEFIAARSLYTTRIGRRSSCVALAAVGDSAARRTHQCHKWKRPKKHVAHMHHFSVHVRARRIRMRF